MSKKAENFDQWEIAYRRELGARLKSYRLSKGISQEEVATATGVKQPSLTRYEGGKRCPSIYFLKLFVEKFGCDLQWLVFGDKDQEARPFPPQP